MRPKKKLDNVRKARGAARTAGAFTMVEMVTVLAVAAVLMGILAVAARPLLRSTRLDASANKLQAALRQARGQALALGVPVSVTFNNSMIVPSVGNPVEPNVKKDGDDYSPSNWPNRLTDFSASPAYYSESNPDTNRGVVLKVAGGHLDVSAAAGSLPHRRENISDITYETDGDVVPYAVPHHANQFYFLVKHLPRADGSLDTWDVFRLPCPLNEPVAMYEDTGFRSHASDSTDQANDRKFYTFNRNFTNSVIGAKRMLEPGTMFMSFGSVRLVPNGAAASLSFKFDTSGTLNVGKGNLFFAGNNVYMGKDSSVNGGSLPNGFGVESGNAELAISNWDERWKDNVNTDTTEYPAFFYAQKGRMAGRGSNAYLGNSRVTFLPTGRAVSYTNNIKCIRPSEVPNSGPAEYLLTPNGWYIVGLCNIPINAAGGEGEIAAPPAFWEDRVGVGVHDKTGRVMIRRRWDTAEL